MNLVTIAEHTIDLSLLPERANILDLGCRGFLFADELVRLGHRVVAVDMDDLPRGDYHKLAITNYDGLCDKIVTKDPSATRINKNGFGIRCTTLEDFSKEDGINTTFWDLIKMDIEGSEYEVIISLVEPPARQLSIEFHLHTGIYGTQEMTEMYDKLISLSYEAVQHEMTRQHGLGLNFWNSLFLLK